jgi:GNAT superfamily N-acetyltransferase
MRIAPAGHEDTVAIAGLVNLAYGVESFFVAGDRTSPQKVREAMETGTFLIAHDETGDVAGCVHVEIEGRRGSFGMLAVEPAEQRHGWGGRLIDAAEQYARAAGCDSMDIRVVNLREDLLPRYRRLGYVAIGTEPYDHRPTIRDCHFILMRKALLAGE